MTLHITWVGWHQVAPAHAATTWACSHWHTQTCRENKHTHAQHRILSLTLSHRHSLFLFHTSEDSCALHTFIWQGLTASNRQTQRYSIHPIINTTTHTTTHCTVPIPVSQTPHAELLSLCHAHKHTHPHNHCPCLYHRLSFYQSLSPKHTQLALSLPVTDLSCSS